MNKTEQSLAATVMIWLYVLVVGMLKLLQLIWMHNRRFKEVNVGSNAFKAGHTYEIVSLGSSDGVATDAGQNDAELFKDGCLLSVTMIL